MPGPLAGVRIVEFESIGPGPYGAMLLADLGAEVLRIARPQAERGALIADLGGAVLHRGRRAITLDLKAALDAPEGGFSAPRRLLCNLLMGRR